MLSFPWLSQFCRTSSVRNSILTVSSSVLLLALEPDSERVLVWAVAGGGGDALATDMCETIVVF